MKTDPRKAHLLTVPVLMFPLLMTSGCFITDMKNSTDKMATDTSQLVQNTGDVKTVTEKLAAKIDQTNAKLDETNAKLTKTDEKIIATANGVENTYTDLRQKEALDMRNQSLEAMEKAETLEAKLVNAGMYCMAFEFQLWKSTLNDTPEFRDALYRDAMEEFFLKLSRFMPDPSDPVDPTSSNARVQNLLAISGVIDRVNPNAQVLAARLGTPKVSILSLIEETLAKAEAVEKGEIRHEQLKEYERQILINQTMAVTLLEARANFLPVMLLGRISDVQRRALPVKAWMAYRGSKANFDNVEAIQQGLVFIREANREIDFLRGIHAQVRIDSTLKAFYNNMTLPAAGKSERSMRLPSDRRSSRGTVEQQLVDEIQDFNKRINGK